MNTQSLLLWCASVNLFWCLRLLIIYFHLLSILAPICKTVFSLSFKHNEHSLLFMLEAISFPTIFHVTTNVSFFVFNLQLPLDNSVSHLFSSKRNDLRGLCIFFKKLFHKYLDILYPNACPLLIQLLFLGTKHYQ